MSAVRRVVLLVALAAAALAVAVTAAGAAQPKTSLNAVEADVMCVSCGVPLAIAESPQADAERRTINSMIAQGLTKKQIEDRLVVFYGRNVLATPKKSGFGLAAYLIPIAIVLIALIAGAIFLPRWKKRDRAGSQTDDGPRLSDEDAQRLDADLANYKL
ncbi:cytochrome c-type biogenesis protein CcmH [Conexibacter woesei]|uniref:cytochrome c-type biogenesis protein CcmH n=1 Tax=Conexibacter woesei TaxID=191495 RepID=UPI00047A525F|nr:cytochrome c-type biogenesis protein CcmH [Conexibacter woesei]